MNLVRQLCRTAYKLLKFEKTNQKNNLETNAGNAIPVRTSGTTRFRKSVGHAVKSVWWMPWH